MILTSLLITINIVLEVAGFWSSLVIVIISEITAIAFVAFFCDFYHFL